jgi:hypothetical protein
MRSPKSKAPAINAGFVEPMLCLAVKKLPEGPAWRYEVKLGGYRAIGVRTKVGAELRSETRKIFRLSFPKYAAPSILCPKTLASTVKSRRSTSRLSAEKTFALCPWKPGLCLMPIGFPVGTGLHSEAPICGAIDTPPLPERVSAPL